jgi:hypothetical protein
MQVEGNDIECRVLGCDAVWVYYKPMFRKNFSPPSSGYDTDIAKGGRENMGLFLIDSISPPPPVSLLQIVERVDAS